MESDDPRLTTGPSELTRTYTDFAALRTPKPRLDYLAELAMKGGRAHEGRGNDWDERADRRGPGDRRPLLGVPFGGVPATAEDAMAIAFPSSPSASRLWPRSYPRCTVAT
jgi:hypothetical protein